MDNTKYKDIWRPDELLSKFNFTGFETSLDNPMDSKLHTQTKAVVNTRPWKLIVIMLLVTVAVALSLYSLSKGDGGFNDKIGNIRAIESIRIPLEGDFKIAHVIFIALLAGFMSLFFMLFFNRRQKNMIKVRTKKLENEISERLQAETAMKERQHPPRI